MSLTRGFFSKDKVVAFLVHLAISATIVGIIFILIFLFWYPRPYFEANGAWQVLRILIMIDLIMGPLLTLILFKQGKPGLMLDMCLIASMQLVALVYGVHVIYGEKPHYLVFAVDRLEVVGKAEVDQTQLKYPELKIKPNKGPILVFADFPKNKKEREEFLFSVLLNGQADLERRPEYYHPYLPNKDKIIHRAKPLDELIKSDEDNKVEIDKFLRGQSGKQEDYVYLPLVGKNKDLVLAIDKASGIPVDGIAVDPW